MFGNDWLLYKKTYFNTNDLDYVVSNVAVFFIVGIWSENILNGSQPLTEIKHQIYLVSGVAIPN